MTSRLGKPDTDADIAIRNRLSSDGVRHFIVIAGAGSGKTTSLIKALNEIKTGHGAKLKAEGQRIACITYTDVGVTEIANDVGHDSLFHISTIHSFIWSLIKPFTSDLKSWVGSSINQKILKSEEKISRPRTHEATKVKEKQNILRYKEQLAQLHTVTNFKYGTGSDYSNGILGHSDIKKIGPSLIKEKPLMRQIVSRRFPVIFVDESQDTDPEFVSALKAIAADVSSDFCVGFFGDPVQKIYMTGVGSIEMEEDWLEIQKPENFRCPTTVLNVINKIRAEDDGLEQTRGLMEEIEGVLVPVLGSANLIILPADDQRTERLRHVREWLAARNEDPLWLDDSGKSDIKLLVTVHRIAATRLGFPNLYAALNDSSPGNFKNGLIDGTAWIVSPFLRFVLPLLSVFDGGDDFSVMRLLRGRCPLLSDERLAGQEIAEILDNLQSSLEELSTLAYVGSDIEIGAVATFLRNNELVEFDERFLAAITDYEEKIEVQPIAKENAAVRFLKCPVKELLAYQEYIEKHSVFATQQGIKGTQFDRVLVVIDDEENTNNSFSYGKYFGTIELSTTDNDNLQNNLDNVVARTRRLFYVCCSRSSKDLAVVIFSDDVPAAEAALADKGFFNAVVTDLD